MNWEAIGAVGEVVGALGVVVTLAYLAQQIRENSRQMKVNSLAAMNQLVNQAFDPIYTSDRNIHIWTAGLSAPQSLNEEDQAVFSLFMSRLVHVLITAFYHREYGTLEARAFTVYAATLNEILETPGGIAWRSEMGGEDQINEDVRAMLASVDHPARNIVHGPSPAGTP